MMVPSPSSPSSIRRWRTSPPPPPVPSAIPEDRLDGPRRRVVVVVVVVRAPRALRLPGRRVAHRRREDASHRAGVGSRSPLDGMTFFFAPEPPAVLADGFPEPPGRRRRRRRRQQRRRGRRVRGAIRPSGVGPVVGGRRRSLLDVPLLLRLRLLEFGGAAAVNGSGVLLGDHPLAPPSDGDQVVRPVVVAVVVVVVVVVDDRRRRRLPRRRRIRRHASYA